MTHICISVSLSLSLWPVAWSLPAVIKLVIYSKQCYNPVTTSPLSFYKALANVWWREERLLNGHWSDVIWVSFFFSSSSFFPSFDRCGAGFVCLNVSTLEELHSCGSLDHIGGFTAYTHSLTETETDTYTHCSLTLWQAAMLGWQLNNTKLLSVSGQAWLNPRYIIGTHTPSHTHTHTHIRWLSLSQTHALWKSAISIFFSL